MWIYARYITTWSNKFIKSLGIAGSIWELKVPLYSPYTMFMTCFWVPRPIRTGSGNVLVFGVYRSVALTIENAPVEITQCMHNEIESEWNEDVVWHSVQHCIGTPIPALDPCSFSRPLLRIHYFSILHFNFDPWFCSWKSICLTLPNLPSSMPISYLPWPRIP